MRFASRYLTVISIVVFAAAAVSAQSVAVPKAVPTATPTPAVAAPTPAPTPYVQTLNDLQGRIRTRLLRPELRRGQVGIKIVSLNSGKLIFEQNSEKYFMPASNMKNFTVAAALERLTPDFRFVTSVYAPAMPDANGVVNGDLRIFGRGDVSFSYEFNDGDLYKGLDALADKIVQSGVKRIDGGLIADESYFTGSSIPQSWEWDDLQWYYGAEISALPLNDNAVSLKVKPGPSGYPCSVQLVPANPVIRVINSCMTSAAGTHRTLRIEKKLTQNIIEISGNLPVGNAGFDGNVTVSRPAELFAALLKERLALKGVTVTGPARASNTKTQLNAVEIAKLESPPLSLIAAKTMKPSQNMYTETLLWTLGEQLRSQRSVPAPQGNGFTPDSAELGVTAVKTFLTSIGIPEDAVIQHDGSGLSRHDLITPDAVVRLYTYMSKQSKYSQAWRDSLTIGGVDGTLRRRFVGTRASGNIRGKTGTIDQVSALSGYVRTAGGEELVFSIIVNGVNEVRDRTGMIDEIVVNLADFNGRID